MITPENARLALEKYLSRDIPSVSYYQKVFNINALANVRYDITLPSMYVTHLDIDSDLHPNYIHYCMYANAMDTSTQPGLSYMFVPMCSKRFSVVTNMACRLRVAVIGYMADIN